MEQLKDELQKESELVPAVSWIMSEQYTIDVQLKEDMKIETDWLGEVVRFSSTPRST